MPTRRYAEEDLQIGVGLPALLEGTAEPAILKGPGGRGQKCQIKSAEAIRASFLLGRMIGFALKLPLKAGASRER
jgi:hypothetical protein